MAQDKLQDADIKSNADIQVSKLAAGSNGEVIQTVAGVPTWSVITSSKFKQFGITSSDSYTSDTDNLIISITSKPSGADIDVELPEATTNGQVVLIQDTTGLATESLQYFITVTPDGTDTIDGVNKRYVITSDKGYAMLVSNGSGGWYTVSYKGGWGVDPRSISSLKVWCMTERIYSDKSTYKNYISRISIVPDLSGNGLNFTQFTDATRAILNHSGWNGYPALAFASTQWYESANTTWSTTEFTVIVVANFTADSGYWFSYNSGNNATYRGFRGPFIPSINNDVIHINGGDLDTTTGGAAGDIVSTYYPKAYQWYQVLGKPILGGMPAIMAGRADANTTTDAIMTNCGFRSGATASRNFLSGTNTGKPMTLGTSRHNGTAAQGNAAGNLYEIIVYENNIGNSDTEALIAYLGRKYNIQIGSAG